MVFARRASVTRLLAVESRRAGARVKETVRGGSAERLTPCDAAPRHPGRRRHRLASLGLHDLESEAPFAAGDDDPFLAGAQDVAGFAARFREDVCREDCNRALPLKV